MKLNWKVRIKNKMFWITLIPAAFVLVQAVVSAFGVEMNFGQISDNLISIVNALFAVLAILGIVTDPTTSGMSDSKQALTYEKPKKEE